MGRNLHYHSHLNSVPRGRAGRDLEMFEKEILLKSGHLKVPISRTWLRTHQSILKEISPGCSLEGLMLKLKLQYFGVSRVWSFNPHAKDWLIGKDPDAGRDWGKEEKGMIEDEMAGWHHWLDGHESEWTPGVGDGQGGLACCNSWGRKESDMTEWLNWTENQSNIQKEVLGQWPWAQRSAKFCCSQCFCCCFSFSFLFTLPPA